MKCFYCTQGHFDSDNNLPATRGENMPLAMEIEDVLAFLAFLKEKDYINTNTVMELAAGEISVHPMRNRILTAVEDHPCYFYSNASVYNEKIAEILLKGRSRIISSIDAGTRETFAKIKGVDIFDKVCENLTKYAQNGIVELKYILLPGVNDNEHEINSLLTRCKQAKISFVSVSRDTLDMKSFSEHTIDMIAYMLREAKRQDIFVLMPEVMFTGTNDKKRIEEVLQT
jgi:wyosine [tRNA(Phe)-imidazoG37] synthetase (radical SAM superfamily)